MSGHAGGTVPGGVGTFGKLVGGDGSDGEIGECSAWCECIRKSAGCIDFYLSWMTRPTGSFEEIFLTWFGVAGFDCGESGQVSGLPCLELS